MPKIPRSILKIDDSVWKKILSRVTGVGKIFAQIGYFEDSGLSEEGLSFIELAAIHEFGTEDGRIPERSFIRAGLRKAYDTGEVQKVCSALCKKIFLNEMQPEQAVKLLGEWGVNYVRKFVTEGEHIPPPLKPATVAAKGSDRPLVDTGAMINALSYEVGTE